MAWKNLLTEKPPKNELVIFRFNDTEQHYRVFAGIVNNDGYFCMIHNKQQRVIKHGLFALLDWQKNDWQKLAELKPMLDTDIILMYGNQQFTGKYQQLRDGAERVTDENQTFIEVRKTTENYNEIKWKLYELL